jgi:hypothetical protein
VRSCGLNGRTSERVQYIGLLCYAACRSLAVDILRTTIAALGGDERPSRTLRSVAIMCLQ